MAWAVEYTDEFERWWSSLSLREKEHVDALVMALARAAAHLIDPASTVERAEDAIWAIHVRQEQETYEVDYRLQPEARRIVLLGGRKSF